MKKFLLRLAIFLSVAMLVCVALFASVILLNRQAIHNCRVGEGVDSVIVGDSHTAWAIDDSGLEGVRNVSLNAEGYKYTYAKLQHLLRTEPRIKRVYLGFSYHNLSAYFDDYIVGPTFRFFVERYLSILTMADYAELVKRSPRDALDLLLRILRKGFSAGVRGECTLYGRFSEEPMTKEFDFSSMQKRIDAQYYVEGRLQRESASNLEYLGKIVRLCRDAGVELVALNTPLHPEYERRVPQPFRQLYERYLEDNGLRVFDFHDLKLTDADFLPDGDHANYRGAVLTSRRFAEYHRTHPVPHDK